MGGESGVVVVGGRVEGREWVVVKEERERMVVRERVDESDEEDIMV